MPLQTRVSDLPAVTGVTGTDLLIMSSSSATKRVSVSQIGAYFQADGVAGPTGATGADSFVTGPQGIQGPTGPEVTGPQGIQGATGPQVTGPTGATGGIEFNGEHPGDLSQTGDQPAVQQEDLFAAVAEEVLLHGGGIIALDRIAMPTESGGPHRDAHRKRRRRDLPVSITRNRCRMNQLGVARAGNAEW